MQPSIFTKTGTIRKRITFTRKQIIRALRTENLGRHGYGFVENDHLNKIGDCHVCAIGAVCRSAGLTNRQIYDVSAVLCHGEYISFTGDVEASRPYWEKELHKKNYLGALSIYFESIGPLSTNNKYRETPINREQLVDWVKKYIPVEFTVTM